MADEQPLRFLHQVGVTVADLVCEGIDDHEDRMHVPPANADPLRAVPFPYLRIPDAHLALMVEMMETQSCDLPTAAARFNYPESLAQRELADYRSRFRRFILSRANR